MKRIIILLVCLSLIPVVYAAELPQINAKITEVREAELPQINAKITDSVDILDDAEIVKTRSDDGTVSISGPSGLNEFTTPSGRKVKIVDLDGVGTEVRVEVPGVGTTDFIYNNGNIILIIDQLGRKKEIEYNGEGMVEQVLLPGSGKYNFNYDENNRLASFSTPTNTRTLFEYDQNGFVSSVTDKRGRTTLFERDTNGNPIKIQYSDGLIEKRGYGPDGRVAKTSFLGIDHSFEYNPDGTVRAIRDNFGVAVERDENGNINTANTERRITDVSPAVLDVIFPENLGQDLVEQIINSDLISIRAGATLEDLKIEQVSSILEMQYRRTLPYTLSFEPGEGPTIDTAPTSGTTRFERDADGRPIIESNNQNIFPPNPDTVGKEAEASQIYDPLGRSIEETDIFVGLSEEEIKDFLEQQKKIRDAVTATKLEDINKQLGVLVMLALGIEQVSSLEQDTGSPNIVGGGVDCKKITELSGIDMYSQSETSCKSYQMKSIDELINSGGIVYSKQKVLVKQDQDAVISIDYITLEVTDKDGFENQVNTFKSYVDTSGTTTLFEDENNIGTYKSYISQNEALVGGRVGFIFNPPQWAIDMGAWVVVNWYNAYFVIFDEPSGCLVALEAGSSIPHDLDLGASSNIQIYHPIKEFCPPEGETERTYCSDFYVDSHPNFDHGKAEIITLGKEYAKKVIDACVQSRT